MIQKLPKWAQQNSFLNVPQILYYSVQSVILRRSYAKSPSNC
jgi:hypothetical protein